VLLTYSPRRDGWAVWWRAVRAWLLTGVLIAPVIAQAYVLLFISRYQGTAVLADFAALFYQFAPSLLFGDTTTPTWIGAAGVALVVVGVAWALRRQPLRAAVLIAWVCLPPLLLYVLSTRSSFFIPRYVMTVAPAVSLALVVVAWAMPRRVWAVAALVLVVGGLSMRENYDYFYVDAPKAPDWRGLAAYLQARTTPHDRVIFGSPDPSILYYFPYPERTYIIPLHTVDIAVQMQAFMVQHDALYFVDNARIAEAQTVVQAQAQFIGGDSYNGIRQYRAWAVNPREIQQPHALVFGDVAILRGYTLLQDPHSSGKILLLYWQATAQTPAEYSILTHIVAADAPYSPPVVVLDHAIADAQISTRVWAVGTVYRDAVALALPDGAYVVRVGLYATAGGAPLAVDGADDGRYPLLEVRFGS
jgi:hypothetical protein